MEDEDLSGYVLCVALTVHVLGEHAPHTYCVAKGGVASGGFLPLRHAKLPTMVAW